MYSKKDSTVNNPLSMADIEQQNSSDLEKKIFTKLSIKLEGFKPIFFTNKDMSSTSKTLNGVVFSKLNQQEAQKLLTHVVKGEQDKAQAMIAKKPELLLIRTDAVDYSERMIIGTAFQGAIGSGDKPMWEMMLPYFERLEHGEALRQFNEQFPNGIEETPASELKAYYNAIAIAIINDEDNGLSVIEGFRKKITCQKEITQGKHFNLQHLIAAYQAYIDNYNDFANWENRDLFWQKVIGYVQRQITAYDAQIHCSGVKNDKAFSRTFKFSNGEEFFPLSPQASGLGFDFACFSYYDLAKTWQTYAWPLCGLNALKHFVEQKQAYLLDLESHLSKECIIAPINCA